KNTKRPISASLEFELTNQLFTVENQSINSLMCTYKEAERRRFVTKSGV
ncbi:1799_t:CDS:1, partial [Entrophospora sp. SA101]